MYLFSTKDLPLVLYHVPYEEFHRKTGYIGPLPHFGKSLDPPLPDKAAEILKIN